MFCNILFVIDNLTFGGGERGFLQIIRSLKNKGYNITVASMPGGEFACQLGAIGVRVKFVNMRSRLNPCIFLQVIKICRQRKIDILHSQGARADFFARIAAKLAKVPIIISTVQMLVEGYDVNPLKRLIYVVLDRFSERFVDRFIVVSESLRETLIEKHRILPEKVVTIYNGIELDEYKPNVKEVRSQESEVRKEFALARNVPVIGAIGRLVWQKGFEYLIEGVPEVLKEYPDARFLIVGDGPLKNKLKFKSKELRVEERIVFTGFRSDIKEILSTIDVLAMPSLLEGLPMVLLEGMAMAKPIIATDIDGISEVLVDEETGLLVPPENPSTLAKAIIRMLSNRDKAKQMGLAARRDVEERFSVETMLKRVNEVYQELFYK
jgi:glycosyltransferase involved in cell wall biosynthesis